MWAAGRGHTDMTIALLKAKADIEAKNIVRVDEGCPHTWTVSQYHCVLVVESNAVDLDC